MISSSTLTTRSLWARLKTLTLWFVVGTAALYGITFIAWRLGCDPHALFGWSERTAAVIEPLRWYLGAGRLAVIVALWWHWPSLVKRWFPDTVAGFATHREVWMALRHKVVGMLLILEACLHVSFLGRVGLWA